MIKNTLYGNLKELIHFRKSDRNVLFALCSKLTQDFVLLIYKYYSSG